MTMRITTFVLAILAVAGTAEAQDPVHWKAVPVSKSATPGGKTAVKLVATIDDGWHIYSVTQGPGGPLPTQIALASGQPFMLNGTLKDIKETAPMVKFDQNFGINVETYEHKAEFTVPIKVDTAAKSGAQKIQLSTRYEACTSSMCLPPRTAKLAVNVTVKSKE